MLIFVHNMCTTRVVVILRCMQRRKLNRMLKNRFSCVCCWCITPCDTETGCCTLSSDEEDCSSAAITGADELVRIPEADDDNAVWLLKSTAGIGGWSRDHEFFKDALFDQRARTRLPAGTEDDTDAADSCMLPGAPGVLGVPLEKQSVLDVFLLLKRMASVTDDLLLLLKHWMQPAQ